MAKEITGYVKLQIKGGQANPAPPVGPALGQRGIEKKKITRKLRRNLRNQKTRKRRKKRKKK